MENIPPAYDTQPKDTEAINQSWQHVIDNLTQATLEHIQVDDGTRASLEADFWSTHATLLAETEAAHPGTAESIFTRAEEIGAEKRAAETKEFETKTLPKIKRRAYMRGFMSVFSLGNK